MTIFCRKTCGPTWNAMVTKLQESYVGSLGEKFIAQQHGFDRDFWAGSSNSPMTVLYWVHVKPRSAMFDPNQCWRSPTPGARLVSRKTLLKDSRARRTAEIEHDFVQDKDAWSASIEGVKWTGVSVFRLVAPVELRVVRTGQGREPGTGKTKPDVQLHWPREVTKYPDQNSQAGIGTNPILSRTGVGKQRSRVEKFARGTMSNPSPKKARTNPRPHEDIVTTARKVREKTIEQVNAAHATCLWSQWCSPQRCQKGGPFS